MSRVVQRGIAVVLGYWSGVIAMHYGAWPVAGVFGALITGLMILDGLIARRDLRARRREGA
jgi:hypothetical protein